MKTLKDLVLHELQDIYDAEHRIAKALPKLAKAAKSSDLKKVLRMHQKETEGHIKKVEEVFKCFDETKKREKCDATVGLLEEGDSMAEEFEGSPALDAAIIAACQKVEHYEIATYGCLIEWAQELGNKEAVKILKGIQSEEAAADKILTQLAKSKMNDKANAA